MPAVSGPNESGKIFKAITEGPPEIDSLKTGAAKAEEAKVELPAQTLDNFVRAPLTSIGKAVVKLAGKLSPEATNLLERLANKKTT